MGGGADDYFAEHNEIRLDGDARSAAYLSFDESPDAEQHLRYGARSFWTRTPTATSASRLT